MNYRCGKISRLLVVCSFFFVLSGKPLSSFATGPSSQAGMGSIPYSGVWTNTSTSGSGFGPWQFSPPTNNGNAFYYVQTSTLNDNGGSPGNGSNDINTGGLAWGMTALNSTLANATRPFPAALTNSQTFQIDMDNGNIAAGGSVGFALQNSSTQNVWQYFFTGGSNTYTIDAASVTGPSGLPTFTRDGMRLTFSLTSASTYSVTVLTYTAGGSAAGDQYLIFKQNTRSGDFEGIDISKTRVSGGDVFRFLVSSATAQLDEIKSPFSIRYPRGNGVMINWKTPMKKLEIGKGELLKDGEEVAILTIGHPGNFAIKACDELKKEGFAPASHGAHPPLETLARSGSCHGPKSRARQFQ